MKISNRKTLATAMASIMVLGFLTSFTAMNAAAADKPEGDIVDMVSGGQVRINDATIIAADVGATNGVIHVIDTVILPN